MGRLRGKLLIVSLGIGIAGCMTNAQMPVAPPSQPDPFSWADVPCDIVAERNRPACFAEHERLGIPADQSVQSAAQTGSQSIAAMREAAQVPETPEEMEAARAAIDSMLGHNLKDPPSAMQYRVSDVLPCAQVQPASAAHPSSPLCICYQVNAKNSYGGYTGAELSLATLLRSEAGGFVAVSIPKGLVSMNSHVVHTCHDANLQERDAALIHAAAR